MTRLGELDFEEGWIPQITGRDVYGLWLPDGIIRVNPIPHVVDTIIHELLHEQFPSHGEHAIRSLAGKLTRQLTAEEQQAIYAEYRGKLE